MTLPEAFERSVVGLADSEFYPHFADEVRRILSSHQDKSEVPTPVIEDITKWVESELRLTTEAFLGHTLVGKATSGIGLVGAMVESGLMLDEFGEPEPIHFLLRWYFAERNIAHHRFPTYGWTTFLAFFWVSNYILRQIGTRRNKPRAVHMNIRTEPKNVVLGAHITITASLTTPTTGAPFVEGNFQARVLFSNNHLRAVSLSFEAGEVVWRKDISTSSAVPGPYIVVGEAAGPQGRFISRSQVKGKIEEWRE